MEQHFELHTAGADEYPNRLRMLVVGRPGSGKTTFGTRFPNPIFASAGGDLTTLSRSGNVPYVRVDTLKDLYLLKQALDRPAEERTELFGREIETLVIDTVDELQRLLLWDHVRNEGRTDTVAGDWGWIADRFHSIFQGFKQVDINLVILARTKDVQYGESHAVIQPALGGAFAEAVHKYVDISAHLYALPDAEALYAALRVEGDGDQIEIIDSSELAIERVLRFAPLSHVPWASDKTGTLPISMSVDGQTVSNILERFSSVELPESSIRTVEIPQPVPEQSEEVAASTEVDYLCDNCTETFTEKTWSDLSNAKFKKTLCKNCYKQQK